MLPRSPASISTQGHLIAISQGFSPQNSNLEDPVNYLQHRYFKYDALGRLLYEKQSEQAGTFTASDTPTGNSSWSRQLIYDETIANVTYSGLLTTAKDARNISTQFRYDNLNRIYQVDYSDSTPTVNNYYDQPASGYFNNARLTKAATAAVGSVPATSQSYNYDLMGRVASNRQMVGDQSYTMSYGYTPASGGTQYAFADHQGSSRVIIGPTGNVVSRHNYAPFGEDLAANLDMRNGTPGYGNGDNARQKYAGMESDDATGLDHTLWRQYDSSSGRWTAPDPYGGSEFLNTRIEIAVILCEFVCALLDLGHVNSRDVLHFRTREAAVRNRGRLRQLGVSSTLKRKHITLCQRIRDCSASGKCRCRVRSVDALD